MPFGRLSALLSELHLDVQLRVLRRRERQVLVRLGAIAASAGLQETGEIKRCLAQIREGKVRLDELKAAIGTSLEADRAEYATVSPWMRPLVILRGFCSRAVLRHQITLGRGSLSALHEALGAAVAESANGLQLPREIMHAAADARADLRNVLEERSRRLAPYGGSALPGWLRRLAGETKALQRALWLQLRPTILPRSPALIGLVVGWWVADTYTDSHFRSVLHSLGIGNGGRKVVSGETYRVMIFWLPIFAAALCAYLTDRAQILLQRRYVRPTSDQ
jgi:hypothetical protein